MPPRTPSSTSIQPYSKTDALRIAGTVLVVLGGIAGASGSAGAQSRAADDGGGAVFVAQPKIAKVSCLRRCASRRRARGGSTLRVTGRRLSDVDTLRFHGSTGRRDDVEVKVRSASSTRVNANVPYGAVTGPVSASAPDARSPRTPAVRILPSPPPEPNTTLSPVPGEPLLETGTSRTKAYFGSRRTVTFSYRISAAAPSDVAVELIRAGDGSIVRTWSPEAEEDAVGKVAWNGKARSKPAPAGRYSFRLTVAGDDGEQAISSGGGASSRDAFDLYDHTFPVRGRHDYGGSGAQFGSGRGGRSHQGHDVFAKCGTPMVAARGGRVQYSGYHGAAGNYIVIDGGATGVDYAYMHLASPSAFRAGDRVYTGQRIGEVGDSGNASGCHLHYEMWGAPGWYQGGSAFDPLPSLRAWDSWS